MAHFDLSYWHATTKTNAYFREFGFFRIFFCQKNDPTMVKSHFENIMGNSFFDFLKYWPKCSKKKFRLEIWTFSFQICFKNKFSTSGSGQTEKHIYAYTCVFSLTTSRSWKLIFKADLKWECPYFYFKFFLEHFGQYLKKSKMDFPLYF